LYVANTTASSIVRFTLDGGKLDKGETFVEMAMCTPDGFTFDVEGNIIIGAPGFGKPYPGQIQTYDRNGKLIDTFEPGSNHLYTNVALSSDNVLFITDSDGEQVLAVDGWPHAGLLLHPFRK